MGVQVLIHPPLQTQKLDVLTKEGKIKYAQLENLKSSNSKLAIGCVASINLGPILIFCNMGLSIFLDNFLKDKHKLTKDVIMRI